MHHFLLLDHMGRQLCLLRPLFEEIWLILGQRVLQLLLYVPSTNKHHLVACVWRSFCRIGRLSLCLKGLGVQEKLGAMVLVRRILCHLLRFWDSTCRGGMIYVYLVHHWLRCCLKRTYSPSFICQVKVITWYGRDCISNHLP